VFELLPTSLRKCRFTRVTWCGRWKSGSTVFRWSGEPREAV